MQNLLAETNTDFRKALAGPGTTLVQLSDKQELSAIELGLIPSDEEIYSTCIF